MSNDEFPCKDCGEETCAPPKTFPADWIGYCPPCAMKAMMKGTITKVDIEEMKEEVMNELADAALERMLSGPGVVLEMGGMEVHVRLGGPGMADLMQEVSSDEHGATFTVRQCLN